MNIPYLVIAPTMAAGKAFVETMGWKSSKAAVITNPDYLRGIRIEPNEDVYFLDGSSAEFFNNLILCSSQMKSGEGCNIKLVKL